MTIQELATKYGRKVKTSYGESRIAGTCGHITTCGVGKFLLELTDPHTVPSVIEGLRDSGAWSLTSGMVFGFEAGNDRQAKAAMSAIGEAPTQVRAIRCSF